MSRAPVAIPADLVVDAMGVRQTRLTRDDIEQVRQWRNSREIASYMFFQGHITPEMQAAWFESIDNDENVYFMVHHEGRAVGLNLIKEIDWERRSGQGGIFLVPEDLRNSLFVYRVALPALDWIYASLGLKTVTAVIRSDNTRAIRYNRSLGHVISPGIHPDRVNGTLTLDAYRARRASFVKIFGEWGQAP